MLVESRGSSVGKSASEPKRTVTAFGAFQWACCLHAVNFKLYRVCPIQKLQSRFFWGVTMAPLASSASRGQVAASFLAEPRLTHLVPAT